MKRKTVSCISLGLTLALMSAGLAGCRFGFASDPDDPNEQVTEEPIDTSVDTFRYDESLRGTKITLLNSKAEIQVALEKMGAEYEKKSGVHIDVMPVTDDSPYTRIVSLYNSGNPPTMSILDTTDVIALAEGFVFSRAFVSIGDSTGWSLFEASWLSDPSKAFAALVLVSVWQLSGYMILIYVAGFMGLSEDVMEAALVLFLITACISGIQVYLTKKKEVEA